MAVNGSFEWGKKQIRAAQELAEGATRDEVAASVGIGVRTLYRWLADEEFKTEVDRLTLLTGMSWRAERVRLAKRIIAKKAEETGKDLLDWLKFVQSETDGAKLDPDFLAQLAAALGAVDPVEPGASAASGSGTAPQGDAGGAGDRPGVDAVAPAPGAADDGAGEPGR